MRAEIIGRPAFRPVHPGGQFRGFRSASSSSPWKPGGARTPVGISARMDPGSGPKRGDGRASGRDRGATWRTGQDRPRRYRLETGRRSCSSTSSTWPMPSPVMRPRRCSWWTARAAPPLPTPWREAMFGWTQEELVGSLFHAQAALPADGSHRIPWQSAPYAGC